MADSTGGTGSWYAVRCVFVDAQHKPWGPVDLDPGEACYEERITLWQAEDANAAITLAEIEAQEYVDDTQCEYTGLAQSYLCDGVPGQGTEVFSLIRRSALEPAAYLDRFFDTGAELQRSAATER